MGTYVSVKTQFCTHNTHSLRSVQCQHYSSHILRYHLPFTLKCWGLPVPPALALKICILPTTCPCGFRVILTINYISTTINHSVFLMDMACEVGTGVLYTSITLLTNTSSAYTENISDDIIQTGRHEHWQGLTLANNRPIFSPEDTSHDDKTAKSSDIKSGS